VNPHGGRHFYGYYCASVLRLPVETTQKLMHHSSISSTEIYYALTAEAVRAELLAAQEKQALEAPGLLAAPLSPQQLSHNTDD
jgi:integrase